ncbi:complex I NDUFA9 subunit family protein [Novosphingobium humi]|uniref:complex I NDUFA9 subunit family protein n=1 Tax=Novosphingobium humi TaxID=2282397 RepID=UPI0025B15B4D|nr:complex I NDUFA9 subunit family protein [Novosphingobium humi]WJS99126.1 complex I NDUFA9 subunit family protein [Novosphingobium humi]
MSDALGETLRDALVVVTGGSGFVGGHLAHALLRAGARLRIVSRRPEKAWAIRGLGDPGQVEFARADLRDGAAVARALSGADGVVNLVGLFSGPLDAVQGHGVESLARAAQEAGARALVHVSAIGADAASRVPYASSKAAGEEAARKGFAGATILRPSVIFGQDDNFLNMFARMMGMLKALPMPALLPVFVPEGLLQPVLVDDVARAIVTALADPKRHGGQTYELGGPEVVTMLELNRRIARAVGGGIHLLPMPDLAARIFAALPGTPISADQIALLKAGSVVAEGAQGFAALGLLPRPMGLYLDRWFRP